MKKIVVIMDPVLLTTIVITTLTQEALLLEILKLLANEVEDDGSCDDSRGVSDTENNVDGGNADILDDSERIPPNDDKEPSQLVLIPFLLMKFFVLLTVFQK